MTRRCLTRQRAWTIRGTASMGESKCRAWLVHNVVEYIDAPLRPRLLEGASPALRALLEQSPRSDTDWVSVLLLAEIFLIADRIAGDGDGKKCFDIGAFVASHEVGASQSLAQRSLRPSVIMSLAPGLWSTHFQDSGRVAIRPTGERSLVVTLVDTPNLGETFCLALGGWIKGWLGLGPRRRVLRIDHTTCRHKGGAVCDYAVAWED